MDTSNHDIAALFAQLGLDSSPGAIKNFLTSHFLASNENLVQASFWSPAQAQFLQEAINDDAEWAEAVDQLDVLIRKP